MSPLASSRHCPLRMDGSRRQYSTWPVVSRPRKHVSEVRTIYLLLEWRWCCWIIRVHRKLCDYILRLASGGWDWWCWNVLSSTTFFLEANCLCIQKQSKKLDYGKSRCLCKHTCIYRKNNKTNTIYLKEPTYAQNFRLDIN